MNALGYPLEQFDDFGRFRTVEPLEHPDNLIKTGNGKSTFDVYKTKPIDPTGVLSGTGDPKLDGEVKDSFDLIDRLAKSDRVRQSIIRHAFRFFMGRNELPSDSQTLIDADNAYRDERRQLQGRRRVAADVRLLHLPQDRGELTMTTRRDFLATTALGATALALAPRAGLGQTGRREAADAVHLPAQGQRTVPVRDGAADAEQGGRRDGGEEGAARSRSDEARPARVDEAARRPPARH